MEAKELMQEIQKDFRFKKDKIEPLKMYLGALLEKKSEWERNLDHEQQGLYQVGNCKCGKATQQKGHEIANKGYYTYE